MRASKISFTVIGVLWLFPFSVLFFFLTAILVPAYETRAGYFLSVFSLFFMLINAFGSILASFILCDFYSSVKGKKEGWALNYLKALALNVFGGYHFMYKIRELTEERDIKIDKSYRIDFLGSYYVFFVVIAFVVSVMMSKGIGT